MQDTYYRIEVKDLAHGIKRWARLPGYVSFARGLLEMELDYLRSQAKLRGQTTGNEYRMVQVNKKTKEEVVLDV